MAEKIPIADTGFLAYHRRPVDAPPPKVKLYDFKRPDKFSKEQIRTITIMHESFARLCTTSLTGMLRTESNVKVALVDQMTYEEFMRDCDNPTTLGIVSMQPLKGASVLQLDLDLSTAMIDRLYGGAGRGAPAMNQTDLEHAAFDLLFHEVIGNLREAWQRVTKPAFEGRGLEKNPSTVSVVPPNEMIVLVGFDVSIGETTGAIRLAVPNLVLEPILGKLTARWWYSSVRRGPAERPPEGLADLPIDAEVLYEGGAITIGRLVDLQPGDTIPMPGWTRGSAVLRYGGCDVLSLSATDDAGEFAVDPTLQGSAVLARIFGASQADLQETSALKDSVEEVLRPLIADLRTELSRISSQQATLADASLVPHEFGIDFHGPSSGTPFDFVRPADSASVSVLLSGQHPQIIAMILAYLDPRVAGAVLSGVPAGIRAGVVGRIAAINAVSPAVVKLTEDFLAERLRGMGAWELQTTGGPEGAGAVLNYAPRRIEAEVIGFLEKENPELSEAIKNAMFVFDDLVMLCATDLAAVYGESDSEDVAVALKGVEQTVREQLLEGLGDDERSQIEARIEELGRLRLSDVDAAQQRIIETTRRLDVSGAIVVARPDERID